MDVGSYDLLFAVHGVVALVLFGFAALGLVSDAPLLAVATRALLGFLVGGLGTALWLNDRRRDDLAARP